MTQLPGSGHLSDNARTEGEMKIALEQLHDVIAELGSKAPTLLTISGGGLSTASGDGPLASMILVRSEGHGSDAPDTLDTISTTNITEGRVVILKNNDGTSTESAGQTITITHGTSAGRVTMTDGASFVLCAERMLAVIYNGNRWVEVWRSYGRANSEDKAAERLSLGLGTASVEAIATSAGASAGKVLKVKGDTDLIATELIAMDASGNLIAGGPVSGGNADTLDSLDSTSFVRSDSISAQSIIANLSATTSGATRITVDTSGAAQTAGFALQDGGVERGLLYLDTADGNVYLATKDSFDAEKAALRINASTSKLEFNSDVGGGGTWAQLLDFGDSQWASQTDGDDIYREWTEISTAVSTQVVMAHGFTDSSSVAVIPRLVTASLVCRPGVIDGFLGEHGYFDGDEISLTQPGFDYGAVIIADDSDVSLITGQLGHVVFRRSDSAQRTISPSKWWVTVRAWI